MLHEGIHGTGAAEKSTEKGAAIIHKRAFNNNAFLKRQADIRAIDAVLNFDLSLLDVSGGIMDAGKRYPWSMSEALDEVMRTPRTQLLEMDETQIKDLRFENDNPNYQAACNIGFILRAHGREYHRLRWLTERAMNRGIVTEEADLKVAQRFLLAWKRLNTGGAAYTNSTDPYDIPPGVEPEKPSLPWRGKAFLADIFPSLGLDLP